MEEDAGVKAPVTRLRRRLSVEQSEENKSPAVNTPTKRRGRKKPDLELIDENTPENTTTRRTKKAALKDIDPVEDKPVTPSRRSTRIKSNTSIVSETAVAVGSPRAKRATRRTSQVGSDNEAPITPVRTTRRTRKDSASSIEKVDQPAVKPPLQITEAIAEEPEIASRKSTNSEIVNEQNQFSEGSRRSPRLIKKQKKSIDKSEDVLTDQSNSSQDAPIPDKVEVPENQTLESNANTDEHTSVEQKDRLSISSSNLIKDLNTEGKGKKNKGILNKSTPLALLEDDAKVKRTRTRSCTTTSEDNERKFFSDNESAKKRIKSSLVLNKSVSENQNISLEKNKTKKKKIGNSFVVENNKSNIIEMETDVQNQSNKGLNENNVNTNSLFEKEPSGDIKTVVVIEDSDSNSAKVNQEASDSGDQCVPVVEHPETQEMNQFSLIPDSNVILNISKNRTITDNSCEPMDVDETMPDSMVIPETETNKQEPITNEKELNISLSLNKSKSKLSLSGNNKSINENKSILISQQIEIAAESPKPANKVSKSAVDLDVTQENENNKKNLSLNYLTSTPLQQKTIQKLVMQVNTSIIASNNDNNTPIKQNKPDILDKSNLSDKENNSISEAVETKVEVSLVNESIKEKPSKVDKKKISLSKDETDGNVLNESEESDEDIQIEKPNKLKAKNSKLSLSNEQTDENVLNESEESDEDIQIKKPNKLKAKNSKLSLSMKQTDENVLNESEESDEDIQMKKPNKLKAKKSKLNKISSLSSDDSNDDDDDEDAMSDDESRESNVLDDEAEDMGDDYKSGDSQDESERQFEKENEILEKGETLTSENELSNDSDYEKDSFIVSSDEEDNELLEGTEDDLSMSDNELKMTPKSKKKYDERKLKEQKMASREMYESRHKINQKSEKGKKNKRRKLSSSESESSESEKESEKPKKNNRMRLDSSHEPSFVEGDNIQNKKKTPRLSESVCDDAKEIEEKEITITNESLKDIDPLTQIKEEPKTPIKSANSTIAFIDSEDANNDKNESTKTQTELMDPLEDSMDESGSLSSENEDIMQNYDSMLNDLNQNNKIKIKTADISLNLDQKSKKKPKTGIVDELNLTQVKSTKQTKNKPVAEVKTQKDEKISKDSGDSSDSIDIHLLFSEDSNDSDDKKNKKTQANTEDKFIPLKRTEAKSNIREDEDSNLSLNQSGKKIKKRKSQIDKVTSDDAEDNNLSFFIDTEGTHTLKSQNKSFDNNSSLNNININTSESDDNPTQELIHKQKTQIIDVVEDSSTNKSLNKSVTRTPGSAKKKAKQEIIEETVGNNSDSDAPMEVSFKKVKRESKVQDDSEKEDTDPPLNKSLNKSLPKTPVSEKKKKKRKASEDAENLISTNISIIKTPKSGRKTLDLEVEQTENADNLTFIEKSFNKSTVRTPASERKKKKSLVNEDIEDAASTEMVMNTLIDTKKKKKSTSENKSLHEETNEISNISLLKTPNSGKKKKISESHLADKNDLNTDPFFNKSMTKTPSTDKKKKLSITHIDQLEEVSVETALDVSKTKTHKIIPEQENPENDTNTKKRKRKSSVHNETDAQDGGVCVLNESLVINQKKKRKISLQETTEVSNDEFKCETEMIENNERVRDVVPKKQKNKKRKEREDDDGNVVSKVLKQNSYEKAPVPRLPTSLLKQLDEKPQPKQQTQAKKSKVISTTQFIVEETRKRKAKPSNYLEESVYLDDDEESERKKPKGRIINPKVLPFVPTASISNSGYTTNFKVNIVPKETKFVAQSKSIDNFKDNYLYNKKIKRQGTYELYKRNRNLKISKF